MRIFSNTSLKRILAIGILILVITSSIIALIATEYLTRHYQPTEWTRIDTTRSDDGFEWGQLSGVWVGFNSYHLFMKFSWLTSMAETPYEEAMDYQGNQVRVYSTNRGVNVEMVVNGIEEALQVTQLRQDFYWETSEGVQVVSAMTESQETEATILQLELKFIHCWTGYLWSDKVVWKSVSAWFNTKSFLEVSQISSVPTNTSHQIIVDGSLEDWQSVGNLTMTIGPNSSSSEIGAIINASAMFCHDGLAFTMSQKLPFLQSLDILSSMNMMATFFFGIEAFRIENQIFPHEHSYNLNIIYEKTNNETSISNIVYHLWDPQPLNVQEETFAINEDYWNISTSAEAMLINNEIQPLLQFSPIKSYNLHFMIELMWWWELR